MKPLLTLQKQMNDDARNNILKFWQTRTLDHEQGGFIGEMRVDGMVNSQADKHLVLNARLLWTFASAYRVYQDEQYLPLARRAFDYLTTYFWDQEKGGGYWALHADGRVKVPVKVTYGQGFLLYAFSEYARATGLPEAFDYADRIFQFIARYCRKDDHYLETASYEKQNDATRSIAPAGQLSMNTHLHILEPLTTYLRIRQTPEAEEAVENMLSLAMDKIYNAERRHFNLFFDQDMNPVSSDISYGHDIEGTWLMMEAAEVYLEQASDPEKAKQIFERCKIIALDMARAVLEEGIDPKHGGLYDHADANGKIVGRQKVWWAQAEAVVGALNAWQLTADIWFLDHALAIWEYIKEYVINHEGGEWFAAGTDSDREQNSPFLVSGWKCPYHNARAAFEVHERVSHLLST